MREKSQQSKKRVYPPKLQQRRGQLIIEATVSISIMTVGLLGIFVLVSKSLNMYHTAAQEYVATNLAAEGIEVTKNILDANLINGMAWNAGFRDGDYYGIQHNSAALVSGSSNNKLLYDSTTGLYSYDTCNICKQTAYKRTVTIKNVSPSEIQVNSVVTYKISTGADFNVNLEDHFYNWR